MVGHWGSSAGSYLADPTSPIPFHCASIVTTSTLRVNMSCMFSGMLQSGKSMGYIVLHAVFHQVGWVTLFCMVCSIRWGGVNCFLCSVSSDGVCQTVFHAVFHQCSVLNCFPCCAPSTMVCQTVFM